MLKLLRHARDHLADVSARRQPQASLVAEGVATPPALWYHSIDLGDGQVSRGVVRNYRLRVMADVAFRHGVNGKSVLDIGAWDGFFSFEAERRGAARVLATDHFCWSGRGWGTKHGFDYAHARRRSTVESLDVDVFALDPVKLGRFDTVLFLGVLYHLTDPYSALAKAAAMANDLLVVETVTACNAWPTPVMRFIPGAALDNDPSNTWAPNIRCLRLMLQELGFRDISIVGNVLASPLLGRHRHFAFARR